MPRRQSAENQQYQVCLFYPLYVYKRQVNDYLAGKEKAIKAVVGYVMKQSRGKADAAKAEQMIIEIVKK